MSVWTFGRGGSRRVTGNPEAGGARSGRRRGLGLTALSIAVGASALAGLPANATSTTSYDGTVTVAKGGDRQADGSVSGLAGAKFELYQVADSLTVDGGTLVGSCTTAATGTCDVPVKLSDNSRYFYAKEISAPAGWSMAENFGRPTDLVRYNTGAMLSSRTTARVPEKGRTWPNVRNNPTAPAKCGLNIAMVMDTSSSIDNSELAKFRSAAVGVVDALSGTPSRVALSKFADNASPVLAPTSVADATGAQTVRDAINGVDGSGWTNWDQALAGAVNPSHDVVLFLTDGDPTTYRAGTDHNANTRLRDMEEAIHSANAVKATGAQVIAVGIGMSGDASVVRLNQVASAQDTYTTTWDSLGAKLKEIAMGECAGKITLQKQIESYDGVIYPSHASANGWQFTGATSAGTIGTFPKTADVNGVQGFTSADLTVPSGSTPTVTVTETPQPGFIFTGAVCTVDGREVAVNLDKDANKFSFTGKANTAMNCKVRNRKVRPVPTYKDLVVTKTAETKYERTYDWKIAKDVDVSEATVDAGVKAPFTYDVTVTPSVAKDSDFLVTGSVRLTNPNSVPMTGVSVADSISGSACTITDGSNVTVPANGFIDVVYTCDDPAGSASGKGTNTATVTWDKAAFNGTTGSATATAPYDYSKAVVTTTNDTAFVTDTQVDLDKTGPDGVEVKAVDGERTFTYTLEHTAEAGKCETFDNVATVKPSDTAPTSDKETVKVCAPEVVAEQNPTAVVDAKADLERSYAWSIAKTVDATTRQVDPATGKATFRYTVTATAGAETVTGHAMSGNVKVSNPNTAAMVADVAVATSVGGGAACTVTGGTDVTVAAGASVSLPYTCAFTSAPAASGQVTSTITWDPAGPATTATAEGTAPVAFATRSETNKVVDVVDNKTVAGQRVVLAEDLVWAPGLVRTFTYDLALEDGAEGACMTYTNTAAIDLTVGTDPTAQAVAQACGVEVLPAESFGKAKGKVFTSCQGTVRATLRNATSERITFKLVIGGKVHAVKVAAGKTKKVVKQGAPKAKVVLKAQGKVLDRVRVPAPCTKPVTLPHTGKRTSADASNARGTFN